MSVAGNGTPGSEAADEVPRVHTQELPVMDGSSSSKVTGALMRLSTFSCYKRIPLEVILGSLIFCFSRVP